MTYRSWITDLSGWFGINDQFIKDLGETFKPATSALFVLVHKATTDKVLEHLSGFRGKVLKKSFTKDKEEELAHYFNPQVEPNISSSNTGRDPARF